MGFQRTLARAEDVAALATDDPPHGLAVMACALDDLFDRHAVLPEGENRCICLLAPQIPVVLLFSAAVRSAGLTTVAPMALRIWRIDLRTASRKARLAFSIRCQRSAT